MPVMLPTRKAHKLALLDLKYELEKALKEFDERARGYPEVRLLQQVRACVRGAVSACAIACDLLGEEPPGRRGDGSPYK